MLKDVILVPSDTCPLNVLSEMGDKTANSWVFLHRNAIEKLQSTASSIDGFGCFITMTWKETAEYPKTLIWVPNSNEEWIKVIRIKAEDIAFEYEPSDPKHIYFLKMAE